MGEPIELHVPELCLVALVGASGSGKSTLARRCFRETEVLSSDRFRAMVSDDENDLSATDDAFASLHDVAGRRLRRGRLTVVDATNVHADSRRPLLALARAHHVLAVALVLDVPEKLCQERNASRADRRMGPHVVRHHVRDLKRSLRRLKDEGFRIVHVLRSPEEADAAVVVRDRMWTDRRHETGPFDIIGDVHGCFNELCDLLRALGWELGAATDADGRPVTTARHPAGRTAVFLGDLVDRGPSSPDVLRLVMRMVGEGSALCVPGNHEQKLLRRLRGRNVGLTHGLQQTIDQLAAEPPELGERVAAFIDGLVSHLVLDGGRLVVAHAGLPESMQGRASGAVRAFAMYGDTTGETDEQGLPVRYPWAVDYRGSAAVVYGHVATAESEWLNRTICIDTGCVFGGRLTSLRWPERELVSVPAKAQHYAPARPLASPVERAAQHEADDLLDLTDVSGRMHVRTTIGTTVTIDHHHAAAALEAMSRFAADPRWLIHLPPTMSPPASSSREDALEHPDEAFAYFREQGVAELTCQEKHMGSRALLILGRDAGAARARFGVTTGEQGVVLTRTGRRFFGDSSVEAAVIARASRAAGAAGLWEALETSWLCLDAEVMPWSAKAHELLRSQYAATGAAATAETGRATAALERAGARGLEVGALIERTRGRALAAAGFVDAYRRYCWRVESPDDLRIAVFHVLASEGRVHFDRPHDWHLATGRALAEADGLFVETRARHLTLDDPAAVEAATSWWEELTALGGEGMVVKPRSFLARSRRGLVQPGVKCRGREYLRLIYGPDYLAPSNLERLRARGLSSKRALALRELALGHEALVRFVAKEPLRRVHECVFAVLALESEPIDPRL